MPNWCENELLIKGKQEELKRFKEFARTENVNREEDEKINYLATEQFVPYPEKFREMDRLGEELWNLKLKIDKAKGKEKEKLEKKFKAIQITNSLAGKEVDDCSYGYNKGGYEWCHKNWGTKWGICHAYLNDYTNNPKMSKEELFYIFETAWSPPNPVVIKMSEMFPKLKFTLKYWETGVGFRGILKVYKGKVIKFKEYDYNGGRGG